MISLKSLMYSLEKNSSKMILDKCDRLSAELKKTIYMMISTPK